MTETLTLSRDLRNHAISASIPKAKIMNEAADEIDALKDRVQKLEELLRRFVENDYYDPCFFYDARKALEQGQ